MIVAIPTKTHYKPHEFIGFGTTDVTKPYGFIGFGAMDQVGVIIYTGPDEAQGKIDGTEARERGPGPRQDEGAQRKSGQTFYNT